jgi:hypothetical protein
VRDAYEILQVSPNAEREVIDAAYRRLARKYHPDVNSRPDAHARMQEINWAYEILSDPIKRNRYDDAGRTPGRRSQPPGYEEPGNPVDAPVAQPVGPVQRPAWRKYWPLAALGILAYLAATRSSPSISNTANPATTAGGLRPAQQVDPYASCISWTEAGQYDGERVCVLGRIMVVTYYFAIEAGQDVWTAHFSLDPENDLSLISVGDDISEWQGRCVAVYGRLFDRSLTAEYFPDGESQPSMINSDPYVSRDFAITEAPEALCP